MFQFNPNTLFSSTFSLYRRGNADGDGSRLLIRVRFSQAKAKAKEEAKAKALGTLQDIAQTVDFIRKDLAKGFNFQEDFLGDNPLQLP